MTHRAATPVSPRRSIRAAWPGYRLLLLLSLLFLLPACGGDASAPDEAGAPTEPGVNLTSEPIPEEELGELDEPVPQPTPPPTPSLPTNAPELDAATREAATKTLLPIHGQLKDLLAKYATAMNAKRKGDDAAWRAAMDEAVALGYEVQDRWNEVIAAMPANEHFDEEQTAALHFPAAHSDVVDALDALRNIERQRGR